jgi:hypothetical protein
VYERAIANVPPAAEKRYWQRYIYLWIKYALFEELEAGELHSLAVQCNRQLALNYKTLPCLLVSAPLPPNLVLALA